MIMILKTGVVNTLHNHILSPYVPAKTYAADQTHWLKKSLSPTCLWRHMLLTKLTDSRNPFPLTCLQRHMLLTKLTDSRNPFPLHACEDICCWPNSLTQEIPFPYVPAKTYAADQTHWLKKSLSPTCLRRHMLLTKLTDSRNPFPLRACKDICCWPNSLTQEIPSPYMPAKTYAAHWLKNSNYSWCQPAFNKHQEWVVNCIHHVKCCSVCYNINEPMCDDISCSTTLFVCFVSASFASLPHHHAPSFCMFPLCLLPSLILILTPPSPPPPWC